MKRPTAQVIGERGKNLAEHDRMRGIRRGLDLTTYADLEVRTEDTFATSCYLLGIPLAPGLDGHPVLEVLEKRGNLLHDAPKP